MKAQKFIRSVYRLLLGTVLWLADPAQAANNPVPILLNPDGAWCWFQDERAVIYDRQLVFTSITRTGDLQVTSWNFNSGSIAINTLRSRFDHDDHNVAGLLARNDGKLMAFYTRHGVEPKMFYRVSNQPADGIVWGAEVSLDTVANSTYANPFQLQAENDRIYNFWRGLDWNPTWSASDDQGKTWSKPANHIYYKKGERPYVKYTSNGDNTIHFAFTEAHPQRPFPTSLYHAYYRQGYLYTSDGKSVRKLADGPIHPGEVTQVYNGTNAITGKAWVWDIALDPKGRPVIVFTSHPSPQDIRYRYARWNGQAWEHHQIAFGGIRLYRGEEFYAGGICLDPDDLNVVYLSSNVDILNGQPNRSGHYEIFQGRTADNGQTWSWLPITSSSTQDNLRPIVPSHHPGKTFVLWFRGKYNSYTDYKTEVVAFTDAGGLSPVSKSSY